MDGGLHVPCTKLSAPLHTKLEGRKRAGESQRLQEWSAHRGTSLFTQELAHKIEHLALTLSQELNLALTLSKVC